MMLQIVCTTAATAAVRTQRHLRQARAPFLLAETIEFLNGRPYAIRIDAVPQLIATRCRCFGGKFSRAATATGAPIGILVIVDLLEDEIAGGTDDRRFGTHACFE